MMSDRKTVILSRRKGAVLVYSTVALVMMLAVGILAIDYGHIQLAKTQLAGSTDAAARAGAGALATSPADAVDRARWTGTVNLVEGTALDIRNADVQIGTWSVANQTFTQLFGADQYQANAVRVLGRRNTSRTSAVPLSFASVFGNRYKDITSECIAMQIAAVDVDQPVPATANPFLAGMPAGSVASVNNPHNSPDYAGTAANPKQSPIAVNMPISRGMALTFDSIDGVARHDPNLADYNPDGQDTSIDDNTAGNENGIATLNGPINALVGVFLSDAAPNLTPAPASLDFSTAASRDFTTLQPQLKQIFFIGDGLDSRGNRQEFIVPQGATRLYLATWDFYEWNNNSGTRTVKVKRPQQIITVK
ncbi:pilus assembly protein TadG-related protein [Humisphaera borealis]|uniref:Putative Flp pilus-assembly TadG-like N-terminal domain-containing protein n=1 Tax=Humisphaera borealis TaxID=2807512 RepID=A0A7M2WPI5_9BACT|nr:pilus assembly protein TadG-related protein [Humisphaera borealis]QOV87319.1 hypothetical protein IPV69_13565 [Humisphaera borealis]